MCLQKDDAESDEQVSAYSKYTCRRQLLENDENRSTTAQELINEQANDSFSLQASSTVKFSGLSYTYTANRFLLEWHHGWRSTESRSYVIASTVAMSVTIPDTDEIHG